MILHCNFEELIALSAAVDRALAEYSAGEHAVAAPPHAIAELEALQPRLTGDISLDSLADLAAVRRAVVHILDELRRRLDAVVLDLHPAAEDAVLAYFEYAHVLSVLARLDLVRREMRAVVEVMTGENPGSEAAQRFTFPD